MVDEEWSARFRTHHEIRSRGAIGNLNDGIEITTHGMRTRLIAWPGNGFQTESVHVLTLAPGEESALYEYDMADEAMLCFKRQGEVYLRGEWVQIEPGDIAYFPGRVPRAMRNPKGNSRDFVLANQICPPQFDLIRAGGLLRSTSRQDEVRRDRRSEEGSVARQSFARQRTPLQRQLSRSARLESFGGRNPARRRALQHVSRRALQRN